MQIYTIFPLLLSLALTTATPTTPTSQSLTRRDLLIPRAIQLLESRIISTTSLQKRSSYLSAIESLQRRSPSALPNPEPIFFKALSRAGKKSMKEQGANAGEGNFKTSKGADAYVGNLKKQHGFVDEECARGSYDVGMRTGNPGDVTRCTKQKTAKEKARGGGMRPPGASN